MPKYINADALGLGKANRDIFEKPEFADGWNSAVEIIATAPAADVAEVKHGEWMDKPTGAYSRMQSWCTVCGKHSGVGGIESNRHKPYCPNCGAKMGGKAVRDNG